jgi:hypothetical protein
MSPPWKRGAWERHPSLSTDVANRGTRDLAFGGTNLNLGNGGLGWTLESVAAGVPDMDERSLCSELSGGSGQCASMAMKGRNAVYVDGKGC